MPPKDTQTQVAEVQQTEAQAAEQQTQIDADEAAQAEAERAAIAEGRGRRDHSQEQPANSQQETISTEETPAPAEAAPAEEVPSETVTLTKAEVDALRQAANLVPDLQKGLRDINGKYGNLSQQLAGLKQAAAAPSPAKAMKVQLAKLREGGWDDLADLLEDDLASASAGEGFDADKMQSAIQTQVDAVRKEFEEKEFKRGLKVLRKTHPDFEELRDKPTPEYKEWLGSLPQERHDAFLSSDDPLDVADYLTEFKAWKASKPKPTASPPSRTQRLAQSETPTGVPGRASTTVSEEEAELEAIRARRGRFRAA